MSIQLPQVKVVFQEGGILVRGGKALIEGVGIRTAKVIPDERGRLGEILRCDDPWFEKFGQVYYTTTYPGVVKAWHYHKRQTDHFYVVRGLVKVGLHDARETSPTRGEVNELYLGEHCPGLVKIPPGVEHGWMCVSDVEAYIVNIVTEPYDYQQPDEFRTPAHENRIPFDWKREDG